MALGRAIIREPVAFLMDEPLSNLDALLRVQMRSELLKLHRRVGRTTIYVTHDQVEAMTMADRIVVMRDGVVAAGRHAAARSTTAPANTFVATFVGSPPMNLLRGRLAAHDGGQRFAGPVAVDLDGLGPIDVPGDQVTLGIRPENIELAGAAEPATIPGPVELVEAVGSDSFLSVAVADGVSVMVRVSADARVMEGERVHLRIPPHRIRLFDAQGNRVALAETSDSRAGESVAVKRDERGWHSWLNRCRRLRPRPVYPCASRPTGAESSTPTAMPCCCKGTRRGR